LNLVPEDDLWRKYAQAASRTKAPTPPPPAPSLEVSTTPRQYPIPFVEVFPKSQVADRDFYYLVDLLLHQGEDFGKMECHTSTL